MNIKYPKKYENNLQAYHEQVTIRLDERKDFIAKCNYPKIARVYTILGCISLLLIFLRFWSIIFSIGLFLLSYNFKRDTKNALDLWDKNHPRPEKPELKSFWDPDAILNDRDRKILEILKNWPGYPPCWDVLRNIVLIRDGKKCTREGCFSKPPLHVHHIIPISKGGKHTLDNLITLCESHHSLQPGPGHASIARRLHNGKTNRY